MKILIVDDSSTTRSILGKVLERLGFCNLLEANDGRSALPLLAAGDIELVLTDWSMPEISGIDLLRKIRSDAKLYDLPVVMITAEATSEQYNKAMTTGADAYVLKPFTAKILEENILDVCGQRRSAA